MSVAQSIEQKLIETLNPLRLRLDNESHMHNVPPGSESHWNLIVVSDAFAEKPLIQRHRLVYDALGDELRDHIHALTMKTLTEAEWEAAGGDVTNPAPKCLGGGAGKK